jgi:hypothetical protein
LGFIIGNTNKTWHNKKHTKFHLGYRISETLYMNQHYVGL